MPPPWLSASSYSFGELIDPIPPEVFFCDIWNQGTVHIPGSEEKVEGRFSWDEFNRLINISKLWSDRTFKLVLDGQTVPPADYGRAGQTREGNRAILPEPALVHDFLARGATVILDLVETLSPGVAAISAALQVATGGAVVCNAYCSRNAHQGFPAHFDTTDVFALHVAGAKRWRIYEGRADNPVDAGGHSYESFDSEHHARAKGRRIHEMELKPGDVLYLPRGQYHEALASSDACLHLSFGINQATGLELLKILEHSLSDDSLFRTALPHFDQGKTHAEHLAKLAGRLGEILNQPAVSGQVRAWQRERSLRDGFSHFALPRTDGVALFRVRSLGVEVVGCGSKPRLEYPGGGHDLDAMGAPVVDWIVTRNYFNMAELAQRFPEQQEESLGSLVAWLGELQILEPI